MLLHFPREGERTKNRLHLNYLTLLECNSSAQEGCCFCSLDKPCAPNGMSAMLRRITWNVESMESQVL